MTYAYSNIQVGASAAGGTQRFQGGVLSATGNVIMVPRDSANIGVFNPVTLAMTNVAVYGGNGDLFGAGVLLPNGNVVMAPLNGSNIGMFNPATLAYTNVGPVKSSGSLEGGAVLAPNGNVVFLPFSGSNALVYNPAVVASPLTTGISNIQNIGTVSFLGGALLPSGNIVCVPNSTTTNIGMVDPVTLTYSNAARCGASYAGCTLIPDGRVVFMPHGSANVGVLNTMVPASREFCLSPFFNKY